MTANIKAIALTAGTWTALNNNAATKTFSVVFEPGALGTIDFGTETDFTTIPARESHDFSAIVDISGLKARANTADGKVIIISGMPE